MGGENIKHIKKRIAFFIFTTMPLVLCNTVYAISESEVQAAVDSQGKDAVAGNVFIWFLCAVAFLKISQKIDSFMSGLGVNVGHTGGNMMSEAVIAAKALGVGGKGILNKGFGGGASSSGSGSAEKGSVLSGGLAGVVGRSFNNSAMNAATDKGGGLFGKKAFESSLKNGGDLAKDVIGKVAKGDIAKTGSITGETADKALSAYLGYSSGESVFDSGAVGSSAIPIEADGVDINADSEIPVEGASSPEIGTPPEVGAVSDVHGTSIPIATDGEAISTHGDIPIEGEQDTIHNPEMPEIEYPSELQPAMDIGEQPEISSADFESADMTADTTDSAVMPAVAGSDGMPELPDIVPDYDNTEDSSHPTTIMPDTSSAIPASGVEQASVSDSTGSTVQSDTDTGAVQPATISGADTSSVNVSQSVIPTPSGVSSATHSNSSTDSETLPAQSGSAPVAVTQSTPITSSSGNQQQTNTVTNTASSTTNTSAEINASAAVTQQEHINSPVTMPVDSSISVPASSGNESIGTMPQLTSANGLSQNTESIPVFSNVEIGGGRIMGTETTDKHPNGIEFGMYNTAQYMKPEGEFTTVETVDGAKWYKQYAAPKVEKTPIVEDNGKIKYEEKITKKLPPVPRRKDRV